jgi:hypothetical protein
MSNPKATINFARKVQVRPYETADASVFIEFEVDENASTEGMIQQMRDSFAQAKALVFEELGVQFSVDANGYVRESIEAHFGAVTEVSAPAPTATAAPVASVPVAPVAAPAPSADAPPFSTTTTDKGEKRANQDWAKARFQTAPAEFFDNRPKKADGSYKANAPDLKHKATSIGVWLD